MLQYALQALRAIRYSAWREFDPEDTIRFFSLRLNESRMIESSPRKIIDEGTRAARAGRVRRRATRRS